jgi:N-acetylmuramoyl-L-alanine amidase
MSLIRRGVLESVQRVLITALLAVVLAVVTLSAHAVWTWRHRAQDVPSVTPAASGEEASPPTAVPVVTLLARTEAAALPALTPTAIPPNKIGIVAGHWQNDSGAVCPDGLTEVEINLEIAQRVVDSLSQSGYDVEILAEFSSKLNGYRAAALVSIHTDACNVPEATGFKVARVSSSMVPELEDRLVACLIERYSGVTGLQFHRYSITYDMTEYHAFYEIAPETPAAIIEIGFMAADRDLLTRRPDRVALGIVDGIKCFVGEVR